MGKNIDVEKFAKKFKGVNDLIDMGLMKISKDGLTVEFNEELWVKKNRAFKKNWCLNLYIYCHIKFTLKEGSKIKFLAITQANDISLIVAECTSKKVTLFK